MINMQSHAFSSNYGYNCTRSSKKSYSALPRTILTTASTIIPKLDSNAGDYIY